MGHYKHFLSIFCQIGEYWEYYKLWREVSLTGPGLSFSRLASSKVMVKNPFLNRNQGEKIGQIFCAIFEDANFKK